MAQITINREDAKKILANPEADSDARVIAAFTIAFFEANEHALEIGPDTRAITLKLAHMCAEVIYTGPNDARALERKSHLSCRH